ncbi:hypothetical protein D7Z54_32340 [Salibacterium salarium]|uniref:Uncharacterized protein n=1 Tax=Salibacterium salarium TaxID=284579 RepID=A0A428MSW8_9BACI|nr:hypothetical protein [Salibacterium salarium]RSL29229.1 hypothetical protein D7Z54_32340 [Salibacterium salarium]
MKKDVIESRRLNDFEAAIDTVEKANAIGFAADLTCLRPEPGGFGMNIGEYYEVTIFRWTEEEDE